MGPEDYFDAALNLLAESGAEALTAARLCGCLRVTKGSFYHHFRGIDDFVEQFATHRETMLGNLMADVASEPDPLARLEKAIRVAVGLPHGAEAAIRAWSQRSHAIQASQRRIDRAWLAHTAAIAAPFVADAVQAALIGQQAVSMFIGLQQLHELNDGASLARVLAAFAESSLGVTATVADDPEDITVSCAREREGRRITWSNPA